MCSKGMTVMNKTVIAAFENIDDIVDLRTEMQVEDWKKTLGKDYSCFSDEFAQITRNHLENKLNISIYFAIMYIEDKPVTIAALEELSELPQITVCSDKNGRHCCLVSVYTKPDYRGNGYQQQVIKCLLEFAKSKGFTDITLTTNTPDEIHIYKKFGFKQISNKYFLNLK